MTATATVLGALMLLLSALPPATAASVPATEPPTPHAPGSMLYAGRSPSAPPVVGQIEGGVIEFSGRGWGHGRGMGQWGAYGYAADHGWTSGQILDHFYGGTTAAPSPAGGPVDPAQIRVDLRYMHGIDTTVGLGDIDGTILLLALDGTELGRAPAGAVRLRWSGDGYEVESAPGCDGPWTAHSTIAGQATVRLAASSTNSGANGKLHACGPGFQTWYEGEMRATVSGGSARTINVVSVEQYLRGVVPNESPAWWPAATLEAQAVAARSYAMAGDSRQLPHADTCDTVLCQVYDGIYTNRGGFRQATDFRTDAAIAATAGIVRLRPDGTVARTEFSSSTGGYTAGGEFPVVRDLGDANSSNPHHAWSEVVEVAPIEARYGLGSLLGVEVIARTGLGADGGRVTQVEFRFEQGSVTESGTDARSILGLKSDWFTVAPPLGADLRPTRNGTYIDRMYDKLYGRQATDAEIVRWYPVIDGGHRLTMTADLVRSDYLIGRMVDDVYQLALDRPPDPGGRSYWTAQVRGGFTVASMWVWFYGSSEYYLGAGGTNHQFVVSLYADVLGRPPDAAGERYWTGLLDSGAAGTVAVAAEFVASLESRWQRSGAIHARLLGPVPSIPAHSSLANRLLTVDDLVLYAEIAASRQAFDLYSTRP